MMKHRQGSVALATLLLLGLNACDMVETRRPVPAHALSESGPVLADGLWLQLDKDCPVDRGAPRRQWPSCAVVFEVRRGVAKAPADASGRKPSDAPPAALGRLEDADYPFVTVAGEPLLLRVRLGKAKRYVYFGLQVDRRDDRGRAIGVSAWPVLCGPQAAGEAGRRSTFAGMSRPAGAGESCTTSSLRALRHAALQSRSPDRTAVVLRVDDPPGPP